jgi:hypothetical protein
MEKVVFGLVVQSIITLILGVILASSTVPTSKEDAMLYIGEEIIDSLNDSIKDNQAQNAFVMTKEALHTLGIAMAIGSSIELIFMIIGLIELFL